MWEGTSPSSGPTCTLNSTRSLNPTPRPGASGSLRGAEARGRDLLAEVLAELGDLGNDLGMLSTCLILVRGKLLVRRRQLLELLVEPEYEAKVVSGLVAGRE